MLKDSLGEILSQANIFLKGLLHLIGRPFVADFLWKKMVDSQDSSTMVVLHLHSFRYLELRGCGRRWKFAIYSYLQFDMCHKVTSLFFHLMFSHSCSQNTILIACWISYSVHNSYYCLQIPPFRYPTVFLYIPPAIQMWVQLSEYGKVPNST